MIVRATRPVPAAIAAVLTVVLAGCAGEAAGPAVVELGTGEWRFEHLADEQEVALVAGSQGGHHVWVSVRAEGIDPENVKLRVEYEPVDDPDAMQPSEVTLDFEPADDGAATFLGWPAQLADPATFDGRMVVLRVSVTDRTGTHGSDARTLRLRMP